jgi:hypothetical protein
LRGARQRHGARGLRCAACLRGAWRARQKPQRGASRQTLQHTATIMAHGREISWRI